MAKPRKTAAAAPEAAQKAQEQQDMPQDTQGRENAAEDAQEAAKAAQEMQEQQDMSQDTQGQETATEAAESGQAVQEIIGPDDPADLLGCEDVDYVPTAEGLFVEYAVTAKGGLRLRAQPAPDAPILAVLPCGAGVLACEEPEDGWLYVHTGRLEGWMMAEHLEAIPWPEWLYGVE